MDIRSSKLVAPNASRKLPSENVLQRTDLNLAQGRIPSDVFLKQNNGGDSAELLSEPNLGAVALEKAATRAKTAKSGRIARALVGAPMFMTPGAMLGYLGMPGYPALGVAVGAGVGLAMLYDVMNREKGQVSIESSLGESSRTWYGSPETYNKTPEEMRLVLHAKGALGDRVLPAQVPTFSKAQKPELLAELEQHKADLKSLSDQRRLLADLGGKTRYGKPALQIVGAGVARELLSRGRSVHLIDADKVEETIKSFKTEAYSGTNDKKALESYSYTESSFGFRLTEISAPGELAEAKDGRGLPENFYGVPMNETKFSKNIYMGQNKAERDRTKEDVISTSKTETILGKGTQNKDSHLMSSIRSMVDPSTRGFAITGAALGACAGFAVPGIDPAAAITLGGVAGHFVGRAAVGRAVEKREAAPTLRKVLTGVGIAAGAGLGVLAAAQTGDVGMVAVSTIAGLGGACAGLLAAKDHPKRAEFALAGFGVGAALGIANSFIGPTMAATIGTAALGAVLGGTTAQVATRNKA